VRGRDTRATIAAAAAIGLLAVPSAAAGAGKNLPVPAPKPGNGTVIEGEFKIEPIPGRAVKGKPKLVIRGKAGDNAVLAGWRKSGRHRYKATIVVLDEKSAPADVKQPTLKIGIDPPRGAEASRWDPGDRAVNFLDVLVQLHNAIRDAKELSNLHRIALNDQIEASAREVAQAIRDAGARRATVVLSKVIGQLGGSYPSGFPNGKTFARVEFVHSNPGPNATICANVSTVPAMPGAAATVNLTRPIDSADFGTIPLALSTAGTGQARWEVNTVDAFRAAVTVQGPSGPLTASADGIGPAVSTAVCPPA
jgi:hypothetical protein